MAKREGSTPLRFFLNIAEFLSPSGWCYFVEATEADPESRVKRERQESSQTAGGSSRHAGLRFRQQDGQTGQSGADAAKATAFPVELYDFKNISNCD